MTDSSSRDRTRQTNRQHQQRVQNEGQQNRQRVQNDHQHTQTRQRGQQGRQQQGPSRSGESGDSSGLSRRRLVLGGGGLLAVGGGWHLFLRRRGPAETVEAFYAAAADGDVARMNELRHRDSPEGEVDQSEAGILSATHATIHNAKVIDEDSVYSAGDYDTVQAFTVVEATVTGNSVVAGTAETAQFTVAKNTDGEWKLWK